MHLAAGAAKINGWLTPLPSGRNRPGEAQLVPVRVGEVKEALAPGGIGRRRVGAHPGRDQPGIERIDIRMMENQPAPP